VLQVNDNPSCRDIARRAVELIAESRKSDVLKHFVKTGEMTSGEMDVSDAYRLLQIPDRTADEGAIMAAYTICVDEAPAQAEKYNLALSILAKETNSPLLSSMVSGDAAKSDRNLSEWPVGLQNIGNTCYLNSLLQFYYSIRPYRNMVLDFESFRMDLNDESCQKKQVGSRKVSKKEIERSQRCKCCSSSNC
jgi:ubiquitin carboxyl-terminal hydrolase 25/28